MLADTAIMYPNSLAIDQAGVIWARMRHYVLRFVPNGNHYRLEWLEPSDCKGETSDPERACACSAR